MSINVGDIVAGKVTGITNFGAFVKLEDGSTGMVHISEVANYFVKDINEILKPDDDVKVKVLSLGDDGKIALSIKQAEPNEHDEKNETAEKYGHGRYSPERKNNYRGDRKPRVWQGVQEKEPQSFEDMMAKFKAVSEDKQSDLKKSDSKRGGVGYSRRGRK